MIKKLRLKFISIAMISVIAVLTIIMFSVNTMNYIQVASDADHLIDILIEKGSFDEESSKTTPSSEVLGFEKLSLLNPETPFDTRYFIVTIFTDGLIDVNTEKIAAVNNDQALEIAYSVISRGEHIGYFNEYRFRSTLDNEAQKVFFIDCQKQLDTARTFLIYSIFISLIGIGCVFVLVFFLSTRIIRPILEAYERQKRFITNAGHELKTPLTVISANNEIIEMQVGELESTKAIAKQVNKMTIMVKNLTALAKLDETDALSETEVFSLSDALIDVCETLKTNFSLNKKKLKLEIEDNIQYRGDENLIRKLFFILLDNQLKYSLSWATVTMNMLNGKIFLVFSNDCDSVEAGTLSKCFERFYRSTSVRGSNVEGSGIGLAVAKEIVTLHKGLISAYGSTDKKFYVKLTL